MRVCKVLTAWAFALFLVVSTAATAFAADYKLGYNTNASDNDYIFTTKAPKGNVGKNMTVTFRIRATDEDMENVRVSLAETTDFQQWEERGSGDYTVDYYPFEITENTFGMRCRAITASPS